VSGISARRADMKGTNEKWTVTKINFREKVAQNVDLVHFSIVAFIWDRDIRAFLRIQMDTDVIFDNPTDTDSESLTANLHDKLRPIALYHYADCRMQTALCSIQIFTLVAR